MSKKNAQNVKNWKFKNGERKTDFKNINAKIAIIDFEISVIKEM